MIRIASAAEEIANNKEGDCDSQGDDERVSAVVPMTK